MFCKNCGKEIQENVVICPFCRYSKKNNSSPLHDEQLQSQQQMNTITAKKKPKKKKNTKLLIVAVIIVLFILIIGSAGGSSDNKDETTSISGISSEKVNVEEITPEEKINAWAEAEDLDSLVAFDSECPEENKVLYSQKLESTLFTYLSKNRSKLYSHNLEFIETVGKITASIDKNMFSDDSSMSQLLILISDIVDGAENYNIYLTAREFNINCQYFDGKIIQRIGDAENEGEYLDEYLFEYYGMYDDWDNIVIRSETSLHKGVYAGYFRYIDTKDYVSDGFDYTFDVYEHMTDKEVQEYLNSSETIEKYSEEYAYVNECFEDINKLINNFAKKNPVNITDDSFFGTYVGGFDVLPFEYLHVLTLKDDGTFEISINVYEGMADYSGTYSKDGNVITCESEDLYFELVITNDALVYHNLLEYGLNCIEDGEQFVK